jgi:hypothetical protein
MAKRKAPPPTAAGDRMIDIERVELVSVELFNSQFEQNLIGAEEPGEEPNYSYTIDLSSLVVEPGAVFGFCECKVEKKLKAGSNILLGGTYAYFFKSPPEYDDDQLTRIERLVARSVVWSKFLDLANFLLSQANVSMPRLPTTVSEISHSRSTLPKAKAKAKD